MRSGAPTSAHVAHPCDVVATSGVIGASPRNPVVAMREYVAVPECCAAAYGCRAPGWPGTDAAAARSALPADGAGHSYRRLTALELAEQVRLVIKWLAGC
eukprot:jgi/Mesvir1/7095/Mv09203-RA.1